MQMKEPSALSLKIGRGNTMNPDAMDLCEACQSKNLLPDIGKLPLSCETQTDLEYARFKYDTVIASLKSSASKECPWCKKVLDSIAHDDLAHIDENLVQVHKKYWCSRYPHRTHYNYLGVTVHLYEASNPYVRVNGSSFDIKIRSLQEMAGVQELRSGNIAMRQAEKSRKWLKQCTESHANCHLPRSPKLPTRVIEVPLAGSFDRVRIGISNRDESAQYAALSYCWGGEGNLLTTTTNLSSHAEGIPITRLPQTVQDAVWFTQNIGMKYLWVDALCILQDSAEDKKREIRQMRRIFQAAYVTIVASKAESVYEGFLQSRQDIQQEGFRLSFSEKDQENDSLIFEFIETYIPNWEPVNKRAWTLEERMLSCRLLIFSSQGLFWQCENLEASFEDDFDPNPSVVAGRRRIQHLGNVTTLAEPPSASEYSNDVSTRWLNIVEDYTERALTKPGDKLVAIAGIAEQFSKSYGQQLGIYQSGIWSQGFQRGLAWSCNASFLKDKPPFYRAPSWSWAAVDGNVDFYPPRIFKSAQCRFACENFHQESVKCSDSRDYSSVDLRHIVVEAPTIPVFRKPPSPEDREYQGDFVWVHRHDKEICSIGEAQADFKGAFPDYGFDLRAVLLTTWETWNQEAHSMGLLLALDAQNMYRRVGSFHGVDCDRAFDQATVTRTNIF